MKLAPEVESALQKGGPVVALESTIISHGLPRPTNLEVAREVEEIVRQNGATPATIAVIDGQAHIGLTDQQKDFINNAVKNEKTMIISDNERCVLQSVDWDNNTIQCKVDKTIPISELEDYQYPLEGGSRKKNTRKRKVKRSYKKKSHGKTNKKRRFRKSRK